MTTRLDMPDFLTDLNEYQKQAVVNYEGASLIIAGAGSGKTRVLTYRIAFMLSRGIMPDTVLALTFTNKAAREMKERIGSLIGWGMARNLWMGTFHSVFARILRIEAEILGFNKNFTIYDTNDSASLVKTVIKEMQLDTNQYKPSDVFNRISGAKNNLMLPHNYAADPEISESDKRRRMPMLSDIYRVYFSRCKKANAMDFDDLLLYMNILLRDNPSILDKYQSLFKYVLVDEYQDTNFAQYLIIKKLSAQHNNVCVVGDDSQSIYSFRGAKIENILNFKNDYPGFELYKLEQNYRSTKMIVNAANSIITHNKNQIPKTVWSNKEEGDKIIVLETPSDSDEGKEIAGKILEMKQGSNINYSDIAILYRTNAQSRILEEAMRRKNIPYKVYGNISFYQRKEIKDVLAYFRFVVNPLDDEAFVRIINFPSRGIGATTIEKLMMVANEKNISIWEVADGINSYRTGIAGGTLQKIMSFCKKIEEYASDVYESDAYNIAYGIVKSFGILREFMDSKSVEDKTRLENIEALLNGIKEFTDEVSEGESIVSLDKYLENISLLTDTDMDSKDNDSDKVKLMTIHSAKGLEFSNVFIAGTEENLFPSHLSAISQNDLEEERRLFYVAVTRAKQKLIITYALNRFKWGENEARMASRFIRELDTQYVEWQESESDVGDLPWNGSHVRTINKIRKPKLLPDKFKKYVKSEELAGNREDAESNTDIVCGMEVYHEHFGNGTVLEVQGKYPHTKAKILFNGIKQQKTLLLKFAKLTIIGKN